MKLSEYLKYRGSRALTNAECKAIGVTYNRGWVKRFANLDVPQELAEAVLKKDTSRKETKVKLKSTARKLKRMKKDRRVNRCVSAPIEKKKSYREQSVEFLKSRAWKELRYRVLVERGARCECCGATSKMGAEIQVDHIKPRFKYPHLALDKNNLQVLCSSCNHGKGAWDETDWRLPDLDKEYRAIMAGS